jgi:hypothetical protein
MPKRLFLCFALFCILLLAALPAAAQVTQFAQPTFPRTDASGAVVVKRPLHMNPEAVSALDCMLDQRIRFLVAATEYEAGDILEAWASPTGVDCAPQPNRIGNTMLCWQVMAGAPLAPVSSFDIPVQRLLSGAAPFSAAALAEGSAACGRVDRTTLSVQFLLFRPASSASVPLAKLSTDIVADTVGPEPPTNLRTLPGDSRVRVAFEHASPLVDVANVTAFCGYDPNSRGACAYTFLASCGSVYGSTSTSLTAEPLENGVPYAVALTASDSFGNMGPLSDAVCETPRPAPESEAVGGCTVGPRPGTTTLGAAFAALLALCGVRRRKVSAPT